ncbi:MAG: cytochrome b N-terminal domain-containing protein [Syntrophothermus sp.]
MKKLRKFWYWLDDRTGISEMISPLMDHLVPGNSRWLYVFGSATLFMFIVQVLTGVGLSLIYQPTSVTAYESLRYMTYQMPLGKILRGIHYWGASAMIVLVGIHAIRVYLMAAFKYPREMSWISGVFLLLLTVAMGFTGQLLRWDDNGVWSAIVGAQQAGRLPFIGTGVAQFLMAGPTLGGATLSRFFAFHVFLIPAIIFAFLGLHLFLVIRNGISEPPVIGQRVEPEKYRNWYNEMLKVKGVPFWPNAAWRDMLFGNVVVLIVIALAVIFGPPEIGKAPDPANINANPRPDWYLLWIFALFALMPRGIESFAIAFAPVVAILVLILLPVFNYRGERHPLRRPWSILIIVILLTTVVTFWIAGRHAYWSPVYDARPLPVSVVGKPGTPAAQGAAVMYRKACLHCHQISGIGGKAGPDLTYVGDRLMSQEITLRILNGGGKMPAYAGVLSAQDLDKIVNFLKDRKR